MKSTQNSEMEMAAESEIASESIDDGALPPKQERALRAVITHDTLKEAALAAGISETTLWRYMRDKDFNRRLREVQRHAVSHAIIRLQRAAGDAVTVLNELMMKDDGPHRSRVTAARTVLTYSIGSLETDELKTRIEELEELIRMREEEEALDAAMKKEKEG